MSSILFLKSGNQLRNANGLNNRTICTWNKRQWIKIDLGVLLLWSWMSYFSAGCGVKHYLHPPVAHV